MMPTAEPADADGMHLYSQTASELSVGVILPATLEESVIALCSWWPEVAAQNQADSHLEHVAHSSQQAG